MVIQFPTLGAIMRFMQLLRSTIKRIDDIPHAFIIGHFVWSISKKLEHTDLPELLDKLRYSPRPLANDHHSSLERISRLRRPWLWLPVLSAHNTCYTRALTLYRFLDSGNKDLRIHFGVEPGLNSNDRLKGHAWVTVDGEILEELALLNKTVREIYVHPAI